MRSELMEYKADNFIMEGFVASNPSSSPQPLVLVVHDWAGMRELAQEKAMYFAKQGFVGFAVDLYGKGKRGHDTDKSINMQLFGELMKDRAGIPKRLQAALDCACKIEKINTNKIMMIGFCMGGLCTLDFARSGAKITGAVSVHGILSTQDTTNNNKIQAKILVLHGHEDKSVNSQHVLEFEKEMTSKGVDWQMHIFSKTMHAFTNPKANDAEAGLMFNASANSRTWAIVRTFTDEIFA